MLPVTVIGSVLMVLALLVGLPGNIFIIWSILARARRRSVTALLILNLAVADGSIMVLTPFFMVYLAYRNWLFGKVMCKLTYYLVCANMYASILLITLMSLYRLLVVVWPQRAVALTSRRCILWMLVGLWMLVFVLSLPPFIFRTVTEDIKGFKNMCHTNHTHPRYTVQQYATETVVGFLLPYAVIVCSYVGILRKIRRTRFKRHIRTEKLILAIIITFGLFWLPYHVVNVLQIAAALVPEMSTFKERLDNSRIITSSLIFISSSVNPILYTFIGKSYIRREGLAFMARLFETTGRDYSGQSCRNGPDKQQKVNLAGMEGEMEQDGGPERRESLSTTTPTGDVHVHVNLPANGKRM
ncbi:leukotriene B4 receptor 2a isoform X2 [Denticeps clupeoides]|nr:leukotriene B4 receptor 1-like isoform X2 [Denticeps clupeoides]